MTKEEAQQVWAAASEYRWRGFDHWWEVEGSRGRPASHEEAIEWIKTSERLPEYFKDVLVGNIYGCMVANLEISDNEQKPRWHYGDYDEGYCPVEIFTHWRRLPELPKGPKEGSKVELDREAIAASKIDTETFVDMVEKRISKNKQQINNEADRLYFDAIWRAKNENK